MRWPSAVQAQLPGTALNCAHLLLRQLQAWLAQALVAFRALVSGRLQRLLSALLLHDLLRHLSDGTPSRSLQWLKARERRQPGPGMMRSRCAARCHTLSDPAGQVMISCVLGLRMHFPSLTMFRSSSIAYMPMYEAGRRHPAYPPASQCPAASETDARSHANSGHPLPCHLPPPHLAGQAHCSPSLAPALATPPPPHSAWRIRHGRAPENQIRSPALCRWRGC